MGAETAPAPDRSGRPNARARRRPQKLTDELLDRFIGELAEGYYVRYAARRAGILRRQTLYERRARDPKFARAWDRAVARGREYVPR